MRKISINHKYIFFVNIFLKNNELFYFLNVFVTKSNKILMECHQKLNAI